MKLALPLLVSCLFAIDAYAKTEVIAQFLWHESREGFNVISIADFNRETWGEPIPLYKSKSPISSVSLGSDQAGNQLLVWTEQTEHKSLLMYKWYEAKSKAWSDAALFSDYGIENVGATVLFDLQNRAWVFWAANSAGLSDIVGMHQEVDGGWSHATQVNETNEVPDITPNAALSSSGDVVVTWFAYSFDHNDYVEVSKTLPALLTSVDDSLKVPADKVSPEDVSPPSFAPDNGVSILHYPDNLMIQSRAVLPTTKLEN